LFFFAMIVEIVPSESPWLAGLISFSMSAGATATYRKNNRQFTRGLFAFVLLLLAGSGALTTVYPVWGILIGSLIGGVVGIGFGFVIPHTLAVTHVQSRSAHLKARFVKIVLIGSLAGFVLGLTIAVVITLSGTSGSMTSLFLALPAVLALVFAVVAAVAVGILRYFYWISGSADEVPRAANFPHQNGNSPPAA